MKGMDTVLKNLNKEVKEIKGKTQVGMLSAGLYVEGEATKLTPIDTGNLRGSAYTRNIPNGVEVGFEADYAIFVHEIDKNYNVGQWKFLQTVLDTKQKEILDIIRRKASIG